MERETLAEVLRGPLAVSAVDGSGEEASLFDASGVQTPGVLDDLFTYDGPLGLTWESGIPSVSLWAPTARTVSLLLFDSGSESPAVERKDLARSGTGVWTVTGTAGWSGLYYLYDVEVYVPSTGRVERNQVTDPYARSLSRNSERVQILDLDAEETKPAGWYTVSKPPLAAPEDIVLYELHVRDFSASASEVPDSLRGTYRAFSIDWAGTRHLRTLAEAGLTHVHLLPVFDIATVNEDKSAWPSLPDLSQFPPDSEAQQAAIAAIKDEDGFNWGYDPYHFGVPEGSYATEPDGAARIKEFRSMVQGLAEAGLRVVMDVVYNHTHASGQDPRSVFDRIVPGYYHRVNADGYVETSTCCQNTASEHAMMERFIRDDLLHWARDFKIDGFRFDLMGHHMKRNMEVFRDALGELEPERDGVDGSSIYLYGEGWDFGEVANGARGPNATQVRMAGTGIGTFNDRLRDAVRGGNPFGDRREQGFATGLYVDPSGFNGAGAKERSSLLEIKDRLRVGMAGNLRDYRFIGRSGSQLTGGEMSYGGYAADPQETINYVSAHDNETLFDKIVYASPPNTSLDEIKAMQKLGLASVLLAQGVPFLHAGSEMLRSKCLDADSYNSGDWFNRLDFTFQTNNFGVGLPGAEKNRDRWDIIGPALAREAWRPGSEDIREVAEYTRQLLRVRKSSPLFRLRTADDINARVRFHNTGPMQEPGLIVMSISDDPSAGAADAGAREVVDETAKRYLVFLNSDDEPASWGHHGLVGRTLTQHPELEALGAVFDSQTGVFTIPPRGVAVFLEPR